MNWISNSVPVWQQNYTPVAGSVGLSAVAASLPLCVLFYFLAVRKKAAWISAVASLAATALVAAFVYGMPPLRFSPRLRTGLRSACCRSVG